MGVNGERVKPRSEEVEKYILTRRRQNPRLGAAGLGVKKCPGVRSWGYETCSVSDFDSFCERPALLASRGYCAFSRF